MGWRCPGIWSWSAPSPFHSTPCSAPRAGKDPPHSRMWKNKHQKTMCKMNAVESRQSNSSSPPATYPLWQGHPLSQLKCLTKNMGQTKTQGQWNRTLLWEVWWTSYPQVRKDAAQRSPLGLAGPPMSWGDFGADLVQDQILRPNDQEREPGEMEAGCKLDSGRNLQKHLKANINTTSSMFWDRMALGWWKSLRQTLTFNECLLSLNTLGTSTCKPPGSATSKDIDSRES